LGYDGSDINGSFKFGGCPTAARNAFGHFKRMLNSVDVIPGLQGAVRTSGRLNVARALVTP
jgi:hypothetical protein